MIWRSRRVKGLGQKWLTPICWDKGEEEEEKNKKNKV